MIRIQAVQAFSARGRGTRIFFFLSPHEPRSFSGARFEHGNLAGMVVVKRWAMTPGGSRLVFARAVHAGASFDVQAVQKELQGATDDLNQAKGLFATGEVSPTDDVAIQNYRSAAGDANTAAHRADVAIHSLVGANPTQAEVVKAKALAAWQANSEASAGGASRDIVRQAAVNAITAADAALRAASGGLAPAPSSSSSFPWWVLGAAAGVTFVFGGMLWLRARKEAGRSPPSTWLPPDLRAEAV